MHVGCHELVLEGVRGGFALLWSDGKEARRYALGLPGDGELALELRAPQLPVHVVVREVIAVAPRGRLRGYVMVPLVPTVVWRGASNRDVTLVELTPRELETEWTETGGAVARTASSFHVRFPMRSGEARAVVPVFLRNDGDTTLSPEALPMVLRDGDLVALRGGLVAPPRRLSWSGTRWLDAPQRAAVGVAP